jgi:hypothetical protein
MYLLIRITNLDIRQVFIMSQALCQVLKSIIMGNYLNTV